MTTRGRLSKHEREIAAIRALILAGMKMLHENGQQIKALTASQRETDRELQALIRSLRGGTNGHSKRTLSLA